MERNGTWHITPAYDMTFTTNLDGAAYENAHSISIAGKDNDITEDDLMQFAKQNGIKNAKRIIEEVSLAISDFYDYATNHQIDDYWKDRIEEASFRFGISDHRENHETLPAHHCRTRRERGWLFGIRNQHHRTYGMISVSRPWINGKRQKRHCRV